MVFLPVRLPEGVLGGNANLGTRTHTVRSGRSSQPVSRAHVVAPNILHRAARITSYAPGVASVDNTFYDLEEQAALSTTNGLPVISCPGGSNSTSQEAASDNKGSSSSNCHALPEELMHLADADLPVVLPPPGSAPLGSLDNRELDKLIGTLGRNKATWRRALVLSQWLQDSGHVLDDRLCTTLIRVCSEHGQAVTALSVYEWMKAPTAVGGAGLTPTVYTYTAAMRAALAAGLLDRALQVWEDAQSAECSLDCRLCITYIEVCSRKGLSDRALAMYNAMRLAPKGSKLAPTVHAFTAAMRATTEGGCWQKALDIWADMKAAGVLPTGHAFAAAMSACAAGSNWQQAVALFEDMCQAGIKPDVVSCTALISALAAAGQWQRSEAVVQWMLSTGVRPNVRTYTALLTALGNARQWDRALEMLQLMQQSSWGGVVPNSYTYSALLKCLGDCGEWQRAEGLFGILEQQALAAAACAPPAPAAAAAAMRSNSNNRFAKAAAGAGAGSWQAAAAAAVSGAAYTGRQESVSSGLDAEVAPGVWGWQAASGRQGLIQRPALNRTDSTEPISSMGSRSHGGSRGSGDGSSSPWTSASQLRGLDLQLQHEATAGQSSPVINNMSTSSSSKELAGDARSEPSAPAFAAADSAVASSAAAGVSSNIVAQQLAQMALQQQLAANVDLQMLMIQQQHYHQTQAVMQRVQQQQQQPNMPHKQQHVAPQAGHQLQQARSQFPVQASANCNGNSNGFGSGPAAAAGGIITEGVVAALMLAYERSGKWQQAVGVLARSAALGIHPSSTMFNTAITAAGKAGQMPVADALFTQACAAGAADAATYEAMIGVLGMAAEPARVEVVFRAMQAAGMQPGDYAYCGLVAAHSLAGDAAAAMRVRNRLIGDGRSMSVHVYNALIAAADRAGMFDKALDLMRSMRRDGVEPDALTHQLAADIGRKGAATVEGQQITAAALSAAMAAAGTLLMRTGVF